jgi:hypothetical protein
VTKLNLHEAAAPRINVPESKISPTEVNRPGGPQKRVPGTPQKAANVFAAAVSGTLFEPGPFLLFGSNRAQLMELNEYRQHAAECLCIADEITEPKNKMLLISMAQSWLKLARQAEQGSSPTTGAGGALSSS